MRILLRAVKLESLNPAPVSSSEDGMALSHRRNNVQCRSLDMYVGPHFYPRRKHYQSDFLVGTVTHRSILLCGWIGSDLHTVPFRKKMHPLIHNVYTIGRTFERALNEGVSLVSLRSHSPDMCFFLFFVGFACLLFWFVFFGSLVSPHIAA